MTRTLIATAALVALMFVASLLVSRATAQEGPKTSSFVTGVYKVERLEFGETCVLIVTKPVTQGNEFGVASC